jgi:WD40 repeat protein
VYEANTSISNARQTKTRLATAGGDGAARVVDATSGAELARLDHGGMVLSVAFSPDRMLLVTASDDGTARIFEGDPSLLFERLGATRAGET